MARIIVSNSLRSLMWLPIGCQNSVCSYLHGCSSIVCVACSCSHPTPHMSICVWCVSGGSMLKSRAVLQPIPPNSLRQGWDWSSAVQLVQLVLWSAFLSLSPYSLSSGIKGDHGIYAAPTWALETRIPVPVLVQHSCVLNPALGFPVDYDRYIIPGAFFISSKRSSAVPFWSPPPCPQAIPDIIYFAFL